MINPSSIQSYVHSHFNDFGRNRQQEIIRLVYEIAKRERCDFKQILAEGPPETNRFPPLKRYLLKRRFPDSTDAERKTCRSIPSLNINPRFEAAIQDRMLIRPDHFIVEESVVFSALVDRLKRKFPDARYTTISKTKDYFHGKRFSIEDYNQRLNTFFIIREDFDFMKQCPCSPKSVVCGYHILNLGTGCAFECIYCFLPSYTNSPAFTIPANIEDFFQAFEQHRRKDIRIGTGQFTDSLIFDHITEYSPILVEFFRKFPQTTFEFKTKSNNIELLTAVKPGDNIVVSWSLNPQGIIDTAEFYTASLAERLQAAEQCVGKGYKTAFHFDPIMYYAGWDQDYEVLVNQTFDRIDEQDILWISLGTLRMTSNQKKVIENRFPQNSILDEELLSGYDRKWRYRLSQREEIYSKIKSWIRKRSQKVRLYLCMEDKSMCRLCDMPKRQCF